MRPRMLLFFGLSTCVGCTGQQATRTAAAQIAATRKAEIDSYQHERAACLDRLWRENLSAVAYTKCVNRARDLHLRVVAQYQDLIDLRETSELEIAERLDSGRITQQRAQEELSELGVRLNTIAEERDTMARLVHSRNF